MKQLLLFIGGVLLTFIGFSQNLTVSLSTGYDHNWNHLEGIRYNDTSPFPDFHLGADVGYELTDWLKVRAEVTYSNVNFLRDYNSDAGDPKNVSKTKVSVNRLGVNPFVDFRLFSINKLDVLATAGVNFEFGAGEWQRTLNHNGDRLDGTYFNDELTTRTFGTTGGMIFKYNITKNLGIKLAPQYTYYYDSFFTLNSSNFQRMRLNAGIEWKF